MSRNYWDILKGEDKMLVELKNNRFISFETLMRNLSISLLLLGYVSSAQVSSSIDSTAIKIGEQITYTIEVMADSTDQVLFPEGQSFMPLEMIESYAIDTSFEQTKYRLVKKYGLTQFDSGKYTIPSQRVVINMNPFNTDSIKVEVADVLVDTTKQKMYEIKPAMEVKSPPFNLLMLLYWLVPLMFIVGLLYFYFKRRKKKKEEEEKQLPPYEEALFALKKLDESHLLEEHRSKEYYSSLTEIIKRYLDKEIDDNAMESTSDELIDRLQLHKDAGHFDFDNVTIQKLDTILKRADLIKFAKMREKEGQAVVDRNVVEEILNETKEIIPELSEEELLENERYLEGLRKNKVKRQRIRIVLGILVGIILSGVIYGSIEGFDNLQDKIIGNKMRDLAESRWIKSEYGLPSVTIDTPEVLMRVEEEREQPTNVITENKSVFTLGSTLDPLYVKVSTIKFQQKKEMYLEKALDDALVALEEGGARNMLVKREEFETEKGIKGIKAFGEFNVLVSNNKMKKDPSEYELILFAQQQGLQEILVVIQNDERFAEGIKDRITNSIELEINQQH
jgi:hypothetical protein